MRSLVLETFYRRYVVQVSWLEFLLDTNYDQSDFVYRMLWAAITLNCFVTISTLYRTSSSDYHFFTKKFYLMISLLSTNNIDIRPKVSGR